MDPNIKDIQRGSVLCRSCPKLCRFSCPVAVEDGRESSTPTAKMTTASLLTAGRLPFHPEHTESLYRCTGCGIQKEFCKHEVDVPDVLEAARAMAFERGAVPHALAVKAHRLRTDQTAIQEELLSAARAVATRPSSPTQDVLLLGCRMLRDDPAGARRTLAVVSAMTASTVSVWDRDPICCGYPLLALGDRSALVRQAQRLARASRDIRRLVVADPSCAFTLRVIYPQLGVKLRCAVITVPEILWAERARFVSRAKVPDHVVYHDPCYLGRKLGIYDEPRKILEMAGVDLVASPWTRAHARCCGFGGAFPLLDPKTALAIAGTRMRELESTVARIVVTACPSCKLALGLQGSLPVLDITEIVARALGMSA